MTIASQLHTEIQLINATLAAFAIDAGTRPGWTVVAGTSYIAYGLRTGRSQPIDAVERRLPELSERISAQRGRPTPVRLRRLPLALEVPHPAPQPLDWRAATLRRSRYTMLAGRNYSAQPAADLLVRLDEQPHTLIAGTTGSGKSTLERMLLLSLALNTAPDELSIVLVDMKNSDLAALAALPHVAQFAVLDHDAAAAVRSVEAELRRRIERQINSPKLLLAIDELRELARLPGIVDRLSSILSLGRSLGIHVIAATQHPKAGDIGSVVKANFPLRLVGQVVGARQAEAAADRPGTGAERLPGNGAFLAITGPDTLRIQAYWIDDSAVASLVRTITAKWPAPVRTGAPLISPPAPPEKPDPAPVRTSAAAPVEFPLPRREPTPEEAAAIRQLRTTLPSLNATILAVYGSKSSDTHRWITEALAAPEPEPAPAKIIRIGAR